METRHQVIICFLCQVLHNSTCFYNDRVQYEKLFRMILSLYQPTHLGGILFEILQMK